MNISWNWSLFPLKNSARSIIVVCPGSYDTINFCFIQFFLNVHSIFSLEIPINSMWFAHQHSFLMPNVIFLNFLHHFQDCMNPSEYLIAILYDLQDIILEIIDFPNNQLELWIQVQIYRISFNYFSADHIDNFLLEMSSSINCRALFVLSSEDQFPFPHFPWWKFQMQMVFFFY